MVATCPRKGPSPPSCAFVASNLFLPVRRTPGLRGKGFRMPTPQAPQRRLPANPSQENLRKQAKRLAKAEGLRLAAAQRHLAAEYGHRTWADLMRAAAISAVAQAAAPSALSIAAARADGA